MFRAKKSIAFKITSAIIAIALLSSVIVGLAGVISITAINSMFGQVYSQNMQPLTHIYRAEEDFLKIRINIRDESLFKSDAASYESKIQSLYADLSNQVQQYGKDMSSGAEEKNYAALTRNLAVFKKGFDKVMTDLNNGQDGLAYALMRGELNAAANKVDSTITGAFSVNNIQAQQRINTSTILFVLVTSGIAVIIIAFFFIAIQYGKRVALGISKPIAQLATAAQSISKGDLNVNLDIKTEDETKILVDGFKSVVVSLQSMENDVHALSTGAAEGKLRIRADASAHQGTYRTIVEGVNTTLDAVINPLNVAAEYVDKISNGVIPDTITESYNGDFNTIKNNLNNCIEIMNGLMTETNRLITSAKRGELKTRANAAAFSGDWGQMVGGMNDLVDAFVNPINVTADYIDQISKGKIPPKITDTYLGDFNRTKNNLNNCVDIMNGLLSETNQLIDAVKKGELDQRSNADAFSGDWGDLVQGINGLVDAFVAPIRVTSDYVSRISKGDIPERITDIYLGDFNEIKMSLNDCIEIMNGLLKETNGLIRASLEGNLSNRADTSAFVGGWHELVSGINRMLDAVILPIKEASDVLNEISRGNLDVKVTGDYKGDHAQIKNALNRTIEILSEYINDISSVLSELAAGNLNIAITTEYIGDFAKIKESFNIIIRSLNEIMTDIQAASEQVSSGSKQVSDASQSLSQGATEQASSVEELSASVTEIAVQTKQNATYAANASALSVQVSEQATEGKKTMQEMLHAMNEIDDSSAKISKIIKVIDDIAFQTNILALNAAVEAARAGQAGKGFAVVADEVRSLAAKSAGAAKETTELIEGSVQSVEVGTKLAGDAAEKLNKITDSIQETSVLVGQIAAASNQQATAIAQIDTGINQVSTVVQNTSATSEETAASSEELSSQADLLIQSVQRFKLKQNTY